MVYAQHLKCCDRKVMWVRVPPWALSMKKPRRAVGAFSMLTYDVKTS